MTKKIMFSDRFGLTKAVLEGRKTMTRRLVPQSILDKVEQYRQDYYFAALESLSFEEALLNMVTGERMFQQHVLRVGEVVAIAQSYKDVAIEFEKRHELRLGNSFDIYWMARTMGYISDSDAGCNNKMFVKAELMPHHIRITDIKAERLQDISEEDCLREGVFKSSWNRYYCYTFTHSKKNYHTPREAFAALIDKVSGKGTWDSNPWVFCYTFEFVD